MRTILYISFANCTSFENDWAMNGFRSGGLGSSLYLLISRI